MAEVFFLLLFSWRRRYQWAAKQRSTKKNLWRPGQKRWWIQVITVTVSLTGRQTDRDRQPLLSRWADVGSSPSRRLEIYNNFLSKGILSYYQEKSEIWMEITNNGHWYQNMKLKDKFLMRLRLWRVSENELLQMFVKPWPNELVNRHKSVKTYFSNVWPGPVTCAWVHLRWLVLTLVEMKFGRKLTQVFDRLWSSICFNIR